LRRALGADRAPPARQFLTEGVVVALIAGAAGVLLQLTRPSLRSGPRS
jgi:ABC-type antimicrobial peptide transport system permease subunit